MLEDRRVEDRVEGVLGKRNVKGDRATEGVAIGQDCSALLLAEKI